MKLRMNGRYVFIFVALVVFLMSACHREALENLQKDLDHVQMTLDDVNSILNEDHKAIQQSLAALNKAVDQLNEKVEQLQKKAQNDQKTRPGKGSVTSSDEVKEADPSPSKVNKLKILCPLPRK